jgi:hypothetical protein
VRLQLGKPLVAPMRGGEAERRQGRESGAVAWCGIARGRRGSGREEAAGHRDRRIAWKMMGRSATWDSGRQFYFFLLGRQTRESWVGRTDACRPCDGR